MNRPEFEMQRTRLLLRTASFMRRHGIIPFVLILAAAVGTSAARLLGGFTCASSCSAAEAMRRHVPSNRPPESAGEERFVDPVRGEDGAAGSESAPWRTVGHALTQLRAGDTLYLRGGVFYETLYVALAGLPDRPITIRSFPGETAVIDGSLREFTESPAEAWTPMSRGGAINAVDPSEGAEKKENRTALFNGEFRSVRRYPNLRDVVGSLADSMHGLQTYYHAEDLRADGELVDWIDWDRREETDIRPLYCGPGLWYDRQTGHIHCRLSHTNLPAPIENYLGEVDARKTPLVVAPFASTPLTIDGGSHLRIQDVVIRGAGYTAVELRQCRDVAFDNVTIWCGAYGIRANGVERLTLRRCGLYGSLAPWTFRSDASKRDYPGRPHRNISRLNTHALIETDSGRESSVYATPQNDEWEIAHCEFTDAHDGVYLGSINVRFHHNLLANLQDDGIYLSPMYLRHRLDARDPELHIRQNVFRGMLTALAFGGSETTTRDRVFVYRNVFDLRDRVATGRPTTRDAAAGTSFGKLIGDHGSPPWSAMNFYHNTVIAAEPCRSAAMETRGHIAEGCPRRVFNNLFVHFGSGGRMPALYVPPEAADVVSDGNLYWSEANSPDDARGTNTGPDAEKAEAAFFGRFRASASFAASRERYPAGSTSNSMVGDPQFSKLGSSGRDEPDYSPRTGRRGVRLPDEWPDPVRDAKRDSLDIGAIPAGARMEPVGRTE